MFLFFEKINTVDDYLGVNVSLMLGLFNLQELLWLLLQVLLLNISRYLKI